MGTSERSEYCKPILEAESLQKAFSYLQTVFPLAHAVLTPHDFMQEISQWNCSKDYFITLHVGRWQIHCSQGPQACGRESLLCLHWGNTPASQAIFSSPFSKHWRLLWPFQRYTPHRRRPCSSPLSNPLTAEPRRRRSCRRTARKRAAATIIALIARFFCWAEIIGGATILLLNPPKTSK